MSRDWHLDKMTDGQKSYINIIQQYIPQTGMKPFTGKTKGEACDYIQSYKRIMAEMHEASIEAGELQALEHEDAGDRI